MYQPSASISSTTSSPTPYDTEQTVPGRELPLDTSQPATGVLSGLLRRLRRERRRRRVGRAYDMALEIARSIPRGSEVLDVGCGNGYIAHHLSAMLNVPVLGIDPDEVPEAPIHYRPFDGATFPVPDQSFDAVLLCYVLHHAQKLDRVVSELRRVLRQRGVVVVYEDIPINLVDRLFCSLHERKWRNRTGPCTFRSDHDWREIFTRAGFEIVEERQLSRWRNLSHPVNRKLWVLHLNNEGGVRRQ